MQPIDIWIIALTVLLITVKIRCTINRKKNEPKYRDVPPSNHKIPMTKVKPPKLDE